MSSIRLALGLLAASLVAPALAVPTPVSYAINGPATVVGATTWSNSFAGYDPVAGTNYGNSYSWGTGSTAMTMTAWASTGAGSVGPPAVAAGGYTGKLQTAFIGNYDPAGLGITSRPNAGNASELDAAKKPRVPEHAIDNVGSYESMLFSFASAMTLNSISIGYAGTDSDATVLVYTGSGDPTPSLSTRTYADMLTHGWQIAGNLLNMPVNTTNSLLTSLSSRYWMVGAYMQIGGNAMSGVSIGNDEFKISGITATPRFSIPEPDSLALLGLASLAFLVRRKKVAQAV